MDKEKLIKIIDENYEWYYPSVKADGSGDITNRCNATGPKVEKLGPRIEKLKINSGHAHCEWCGKINQIRRTHKKVIGKDNIHWAHHCQTCQLWYDEKTKTFRKTYLNK